MKKLITFNLVLTFLIIIVLLLIKPTHYSEKDDFLNFFIILISLVNSSLFIFNMKSVLNNWINFNTFFIIGYVIVHFQIIFLDTIGSPPTNPEFVWINKSVVNYANWISCLALSFYIIFSLLYYTQLKKSNFVFKKSRKTQHIKTKLIDTFILVIFLLFLVLVGSSFLSGSYDGGESWGTGASYVFVILRACLVVRLIYLFHNYNLICRSKKIGFYRYLLKNKIVVAVLVFFLWIFINSGDRGPIMEFALIFLFLFSLFVKRIKLSQLLIVVIIGSVFMTILRDGRAIKDSNENILSRGVENIGDKGSFGFTEELATSVRILFRAVNIIPNSQDYLYGRTMLIDLSTSIPFLSGFIINNFDISKEYISSTYFFTIEGQGVHYTYGEGSELLGDIYINFGVLGILIIFSCFGYFIAKMSFNTQYTHDFIPLIVIVVYCSSAIYLNRSVFFYPMQLLTFVLLFDYIFRKKLT